MRILLIGNGGREHAIAKCLSQSKSLEELFIAPGNPGTAECGTNVSLRTSDFEALSIFIAENDINLIIVGPEAPLVEGIADYFNTRGVPVVGPSMAGAQLEGSKSFAKKFMKKYGIPTADYFECNKENIEQAFEFLDGLKPPYVLKADGLAGGKGVLIIDNLEEAKNELRAMLDGMFGTASSKVVIEEYLSGIEFSVFVLTDGESFLLLPEAKDYKRIGEGDTGLNTGGMGAISPVPFVDSDMMNKVIMRIISPTIEGLKSEKIDYKGFIFFGLININENPYVIEYNCRMGDPESEVVFPRITSDLVPALASLSSQTLDKHKIEISKKTACTVMMVSGGYPGQYSVGKHIDIGTIHESSILFHAGTRFTNNELVTSGGRVIAVTSLGDSIEESLANSYDSILNINYEGAYFRKDIGHEFI